MYLIGGYIYFYWFFCGGTSRVGRGPKFEMPIELAGLALLSIKVTLIFFFGGKRMVLG